MSDRIPLYYTFGNHQHWVDLQWLWGYDVLPGAIRDMLLLCREAGVKGCVNFDGIGYEKLSAEDPEAFADLREAVRKGVIEIVGGSYGQPYGLFHGWESNIRQRIFGARTVRRLFGVPLKTFWEEEFDFFPQLPQVLRGVGVECASLFFQWTWHTPEVPREEVPAVWWEGQDGSRLACATRNRLNLHQWPEDMDIVLESLAEGTEALGAHSSGVPMILQWLELMPTPDWMCRSELILPKLKQLMSDARFEVRPVTLGEYLAQADVPDEEVRRYAMGDVWHGMTLGKNGDSMRRLSREAESSLLAAETLAAIAGLSGRPYAQWDVYPTWEIEEAWRELLSAQHHDNDECEGLCGHVARFSYDRSLSLSRHIAARNLKGIAKRLVAQDGVPTTLLLNPLGWERQFRAAGGRLVAVPAFGFVTLENAGSGDGESWLLERDGLQIEPDHAAGFLRQIRSREFPNGVFRGEGAFGFTMRRDGVAESLAPVSLEPSQGEARLGVALDCVHPGAHAHVVTRARRPDGGLNSALQTAFRLAFRPRLIADQPLGVSEIQPTRRGLKKYPTGDWMTSPQWFEEVHGAFTSLSFVDLVDADDPDRGLLIAHDGCGQWFLDEDGETVRCILNAYDPWDEDYFLDRAEAHFLLIPHGPITNAERWKIAQEFVRPVIAEDVPGPASGSVSFSAASCGAPNVALTGFYRETRDCAKGQPAHAADALGVDYPYVIRMVELDGVETEAVISFGATVGGALRTNLLGEPESDRACETTGSNVSVRLQPFEIATLYLDLVEGRKQVRDLDAKREIWATVHRVDG